MNALQHSEWAKALTLGLLGLLSTVAAHRTVAVYHDGLRTSVPELWLGEKTRSELGRYAYTISIGYVLAYALPFPLASGVMLISVICLGADVIGIRMNSVLASARVGFAFAVAVTAATDLFLHGVRQLPTPPGDLSLLWRPVLYGFPFLAALAAGYQHGTRWGVMATAGTAAVWAAFRVVLGHVGHTADPTLTAGLWALAVVGAVLLVIAFREVAESPPGTGFFEDKIRRIRRKGLILVPIAAVISLAASQGWLAGAPLQVAGIATDHRDAALAVALVSLVGFFPTQGMTGLVSGVWNQDGYPDWLLGAGYATANPAIAACGGAVLMMVELLSLTWVGKVMTRRPGVVSLGLATRDSMDTLAAVGFLAGGVIAAFATAGAAGAGAIVVAHAVNENHGRRITPTALPVVAYLGVAVVAGLARRAGWR